MPGDGRALAPVVGMEAAFVDRWAGAKFGRVACQIGPGDVDAVEEGTRQLRPQASMHTFERGEFCRLRPPRRDCDKVNVTGVWLKIVQRD